MHDETEQVAPTTRTPRDQGVENMVSATIRLLEKRDPEQITIREIAEESGHHHRFVQAWFGGKVGLFRAAFERLTTETAAQLAPMERSEAGFDAKIPALISLMNWLVATDPRSFDGQREMPILAVLIDVYRSQFGFDPNLARLMALRVMGTSIAMTLFSAPLGINPDDRTAISQLEREIAVLVAESSLANGDGPAPKG